MEPLAWTTVQRRAVDLLPYEYNPRKMTAQQKRKLRESLEKFGFVEIPAINRDETLLAGHRRCEGWIALGRGEELIDVRYPSRQLTDQEFKEYNVASNAIKGDWIDELLQEHFEEVDLADYGIQLAAVEEAHEKVSAKLDTPELPIVAKFSEHYTAFVVVCTNAIDANHVAEVLKLEPAQSYKSDRVGRTNVINAKQFIDAWKAAKS